MIIASIINKHVENKGYVTNQGRTNKGGHVYRDIYRPRIADQNRQIASGQLITTANQTQMANPILIEIIVKHLNGHGYYINRVGAQLGIYTRDSWLGFIRIDHGQVIINIQVKTIDYESTPIHQSDPELLTKIDKLLADASGQLGSTASTATRRTVAK